MGDIEGIDRDGDNDLLRDPEDLFDLLLLVVRRGVLGLCGLRAMILKS